MTWFLFYRLAVAVTSNVVAVYALKASRGFTQWQAALLACVTILITQYQIARAMFEGSPMGVVVAINVGVVGAAAGVIGWLAFGERLTAWQTAGLALTVLGVVVANLATPAPPPAE